MLKKLANSVTTWPKLVFFVMLVIVALVSAGVLRLSYSGTGDSGFPTSSKLTKDVLAIKQRFSGENTLLFVVTGGDLTRSMQTSCGLVAFLEAQPEIVAGSVLGLASANTKSIREASGDIIVSSMSENCEQAPLQTRDLINQFAAGTGPQRSFLVGPDDQLFVYADVLVENGAFAPFVSKMKKALPSIIVPGSSATMTGQPVFLAALQVYSERIVIFMPFVILIIGLLHYEALRSVQAVIIPLLTGILSTSMAFGAAGWIGVPIDEYTSTAPILVMAVAAGHSVQLLKRYMELLADLSLTASPTRTESLQAINLTLFEMAPILTAAAVSASLCLFALATLDVPAIAQFGFVAGAGILFALLLEVMFIPALRAMLPAPHVGARYSKIAPHWEALLRGFSWVTTKANPMFVGLTTLLGVSVLALGAAQVTPSHSLTTIFATSTTERQELAAVTSANVGPYALDVVIDSGAAEGAFEPRILNSSHSLASALQLEPHVKAIASPVDMLTFLKCKFATIANCQTTKIESREEASQLWTTLNDGGSQSFLIDETGQYLRMRVFLDTDETNAVRKIAKLAENTLKARGLTVMLGGSAITPMAIADGIISAATKKIFLILAIVAITGLVCFHSWLAAVLFVIPSAVTALTTYAFLGWTGTPLNVATATITALAVGIGVDYLVYMTFRIKTELAQSRDWEIAIRTATLTAGGASLCVATAVAGGYLVLLASRDFMVHQWLGTLIPLSMVSSLVGALVLYPFALRLMKPEFLLRQPKG
jgi:uncharacterized protein